LIALGHEARLMPPNYVKAYVKRNKHDVADAEAICEAVRRPSMRCHSACNICPLSRGIGVQNLSAD
jgi:transposase